MYRKELSWLSVCCAIMCLVAPLAAQSETLLSSEKETSSGVWCTLCRYFPPVRENPWLLVVVPLGVLLVLFLVCKLIRLMIRVR
ncbi:MAG: hypothetical protein IKR48_10570 [Kiritimatiellae bacterium]|nr:hypothetical protein [Kiritimatiellia bacterium]